jgi:hypothetical protein
MVNNYIGLLGLKIKVLGLLVFGCKCTWILFIPLSIMLHMFLFMSHILKCMHQSPYFTVLEGKNKRICVFLWCLWGGWCV